MAGSFMHPPKASDALVQDIIRATLESIATTDDGNQWAADALRRRGWTVLAPAVGKDREG